LAIAVASSRYDRGVAILAAVDDFLFRSKIRATAKHVDADIRFAQTQRRSWRRRERFIRLSSSSISTARRRIRSRRSRR